MYRSARKAFHEQRFRTSRQGAERGRKQKPAPRKTKWKREIERVGTTVYAAQTILRFQGIENYLTPEQIANMKAVANMQYHQEIGATNG